MDNGVGSVPCPWQNKQAGFIYSLWQRLATLALRTCSKSFEMNQTAKDEEEVSERYQPQPI
jgi:hypothetical protein